MNFHMYTVLNCYLPSFNMLNMIPEMVVVGRYRLPVSMM